MRCLGWTCVLLLKSPAPNSQTLKTFWENNFPLLIYFVLYIYLFVYLLNVKDVILQAGVIVVLCSVAQHRSVFIVSHQGLPKAAC